MRPTRPAREADAHGRRPTMSTTMSSLKNRVLGDGALKPRHPVSPQICSKKAPAPAGNGRGRDQQTIARTWMRMNRGGGGAGRGRPGATSRAVRRRRRGGRDARHPGRTRSRTATMQRRTLLSRCRTAAGQRTPVTDQRNRTSLPMPPTQNGYAVGDADSPFEEQPEMPLSRSERPIEPTHATRIARRQPASELARQATRDPGLLKGATTWTPTWAMPRSALRIRPTSNSPATSERRRQTWTRSGLPPTSRNGTLQPRCPPSRRPRLILSEVPTSRLLRTRRRNPPRRPMIPSERRPSSELTQVRGSTTRRRGPRTRSPARNRHHERTRRRWLTAS